jgi:hypothetical protein
MLIKHQKLFIGMYLAPPLLSPSDDPRLASSTELTYSTQRAQHKGHSIAVRNVLSTYCKHVLISPMTSVLDGPASHVQIIPGWRCISEHHDIHPCGVSTFLSYWMGLELAIFLRAGALQASLFLQVLLHP